MRYYTIQNDSILIAENRQALERFYDNVFELPEDYEEGKYIIGEVEEEIEVPDYDPETGKQTGTHTEVITIQKLVPNPNWEEEQAEKERERLDSLYMTRSDFFDGMIMAFGLDSKELRIIVENVLGSINITPVQTRVALNNYDNALNFYRKHTLFVLINNVQIPINETTYLLFTSEIWDKFFDTKDYTELQKAIHQVEPEPEPEDEEETSEPEEE